MSHETQEAYDACLARFTAAAREAGQDRAPYEPDVWADQHGVHVDDATCKLADQAYTSGRKIAEADDINECAW